MREALAVAGLDVGSRRAAEGSLLVAEHSVDGVRGEESEVFWRDVLGLLDRVSSRASVARSTFL